jgi:hypothetical protein
MKEVTRAGAAPEFDEPEPELVEPGLIRASRGRYRRWLRDSQYQKG